MDTDWQASILKSLTCFYEQELLSSEDVKIVTRAPYFGQYGWALHFGPASDKWPSFHDILRLSIEPVLLGEDCRLTHSPKIFAYNLFGTDASLLAKIASLKDISFTSIHIIERNCWRLPLPKAKPKGLYYGKYSYRVRFKDRDWYIKPEYLNKIALALDSSGQHWLKAGHVKNTFLYCVSAQEAILVKLLFPHLVEEISDRSYLALTK